jgi:hypothetical protein
MAKTSVGSVGWAIGAFDDGFSIKAGGSAAEARWVELWPGFEAPAFSDEEFREGSGIMTTLSAAVWGMGVWKW